MSPSDSKISTNSCGVTRCQPLSFDAQRSGCGINAHEVSSRNSNTNRVSAPSQRLELSSMVNLPMPSTSTSISHCPTRSPSTIALWTKSSGIISPSDENGILIVWSDGLQKGGKERGRRRSLPALAVYGAESCIRYLHENIFGNARSFLAKMCRRSVYCE